MRPTAYFAPLLASALLCSCRSSSPREPREEAPESAQRTHAEIVAGLERREGLFTVYVDPAAARAWFELPAAGLECLYVEGLTRGLGSNDVGLDRGQLGATRVVEFRRVGSRVLLEAPGLGYRATSGGEAAAQAARDSFATSVLWAGEVAAEAPGGGWLFEATGLLVRDAHGSAQRLQANGGSWSLDSARSLLLADETLVFPDNLELEALLTFAGERAGRDVREVAPSADSVSLVQHHSFVRLPDGDFRPREWNEAQGAFARSYVDVTAPVGEANRKHLAVRHRLALDLEAGPDVLGEYRALEPIVYYVDRAAPEPVRSALVEGAGWWSAAFRNAGVSDGFRVELLPAGVHPLDVRYNVIQWVHRSSRGWSYGGGVVDPRSGEMIKGHVTLGSLRVRQDRMIFEGLFGADATGQGGPNDPLELALARLRQLAAHEVGHTLGLAHNFAASAHERCSVMDYPAPLVELDERGELDAARAYTLGVGSWDEYAIQMLYVDLLRDQGRNPVNARIELDPVRLVLHESESLRVSGSGDGGLNFASDADARPAGAAHPQANLWDNGADPIAELARVMEVRRVALAGFGPDRIPRLASTAGYEEVFLPLYFWHRYQVEAAAKSIGGYRYAPERRHISYLLSWPESVDAPTQRRALAELLKTLAPEALDVPEFVARGLPPRTLVAGRRREVFDGRTAPLLDTLGLAEAAARLTLRGLLQPQRLGRVVDQHLRDPRQLSPAEVFESLAGFFEAPAAEPAPRAHELNAVLRDVIVDETLNLARDGAASPRVRAEAEAALRSYRGRLREVAPREAADEALVARIERFLGRESDGLLVPGVARELPPGSPIGSQGAFPPPGPNWGDCSAGPGPDAGRGWGTE